MGNASNPGEKIGEREYLVYACFHRRRRRGGAVGGVAHPGAGDRLFAGRGACGRPGIGLDRSGSPLRPGAFSCGVAGGGGDPVRGQPHPALQRAAGHEHGGIAPGEPRGVADLGGGGRGGPPVRGPRLGVGGALWGFGDGDGTHGDRTAAALRASQRQGGHGAALGGDRDRPDRGAGGGAGLSVSRQPSAARSAGLVGAVGVRQGGGRGVRHRLDRGRGAGTDVAPLPGARLP